MLYLTTMANYWFDPQVKAANLCLFEKTPNWQVNETDLFTPRWDFGILKFIIKIHVRRAVQPVGDIVISTRQGCLSVCLSRSSWPNHGPNEIRYRPENRYTQSLRSYVKTFSFFFEKLTGKTTASRGFSAYLLALLFD